MSGLLAALKSANLPRIIAVFGANLTEVKAAVEHARTASGSFPIWAFCAEDVSGDSELLASCGRVIHSPNVSAIRRQLRAVRPALVIVSWTGSSGHAGLKWIPLTIPPFRAHIMNEAGGVFQARPGRILLHLKRRMRDACLSAYRRAGDYLAASLNWAWEFLLAVLGFLARWTGPLACRVVAGLKHRQPLDIPFEPASDNTFIEVDMPNRGWPRREVLRAAQSQENFIVFRMKGERDSPVPLVDLACHTNAFAAARQSAHSAWRRRIVPKHPFRRLQQGEISEVFAPYSTLIVMRRDVLLRVGVPRALTHGAALMMIFWKTAAAGLKHIVAGAARPVHDEPAMLLEDAELALHLTLSRRMSSLGSLRPARLHGNVAWSPSHSRPFRGKPRVLIVSPYLPFPLSHGGAVRIYNLCSALAGQIDFVLACFREAGESVRYDELHRVFRQVYIVDADEKNADPSVPKQVAEYRNSAMADLIERLCLESGIDIVQLEYTQLAEYRRHTASVPVLLVEHDITFTLYRQLADFNGTAEMREQYRLWRRFEDGALRSTDRVWTVSDQDRSIAIEHGAPAERADAIPNGVDLDRFAPVPKSGGPPVILFVGSFRHLPNLLAFESLRQSIMPYVWRECPEAILHVIAGPHHEKAAKAANKTGLLKPDSRIVLEGFVEDVRQAYRDADVIAIPLPVSAGTNIKLFEAMACGRAVVSTPEGCRGLELEDGGELLIRGIDDSFSRAILTLLRDEDRRRAIARQARATAERRFGWDAIARQALGSYTAMIEKTAVNASGGSTEHIESSL